MEQLFADAGRGLLSLILEDIHSVQPCVEREFRIDGTDLAYLLVDWLNELLFAFESQRLLLSDFDIRIDPQGLAATARGETIDEVRHQLAHEVKAITYHGLFVQQIAGKVDGRSYLGHLTRHGIEKDLSSCIDSPLS